MSNNLNPSKILGAFSFLLIGTFFSPQSAHAKSLSPVSGNDYPNTVYPVDNAEALVNPNTGWITYYFTDGIMAFASHIDYKKDTSTTPHIAIPAVTRTCSTDNNGYLKSYQIGQQTLYMYNYGSNCTVNVDDTKYNLDNDRFIAHSIPGSSEVYLRVPMSYVEPREGVYKWDFLEMQIKRWAALGKKTSLCIFNSENYEDTNMPMPYATPQWVFADGAAFHPFDPIDAQEITPQNVDNEIKIMAQKGIIPSYEPDFDDPIFLKKLEDFISEFAKKYDNDPRVDFIDVCSFGVHGEGHTATSTKRSYEASTIAKHIDLYEKYFKNKALYANHNWAYHERDMTPDKNGNRTGHTISTATVANPDLTIIKYAHDKGLHFRDNSIMGGEHKDVGYYDQAMAQNFYKDTAVIIEPTNYTVPNPIPAPSTPLPTSTLPTATPNAWYQPSALFDAMEAYHASYVGADWISTTNFYNNPAVQWFSVPPLPQSSQRKQQTFQPGLLGLMTKMALRMGYRFNFTTVSWPANISSGQPFTVQFSIRNNGVAACYQGGYAIVGFFDNGGNLVASGTDTSFNVRDLAVGPIDTAAPHSGSATIKLPAGQYTIAVAIGDENGKPVYNLPYDGKGSVLAKELNYNVQEGFYPLGKIEVKSGIAINEDKKRQNN